MVNKKAQHTLGSISLRSSS